MHEKSDTGAFTDASTGSSSKTDSVSGVTIGVDVGGTKIAAGVVDGHGTMLRTARRPTPRHDSSAVLTEVADVVNELQAGVDDLVLFFRHPVFGHGGRGRIEFSGKML